MPAKNPAPAPPVMCTFAKAGIRWRSPTEDEDDLLDKAWGLDPDSRLSCQAVVGDADLVVEIPKYTINMVSENH